jgi:FdhD protein
MAERTKEIKVLRAYVQERQEKLDLVAVETPLTLVLNGQEFITLLCTPDQMEHLAVGFLRSEGILKAKEDVVSVHYDEEQGSVMVRTAKEGGLAEKLYGKRTLTSGCGKGTIFFNVLDSLTSKPLTHPVPVTPAEILSLNKELQERGNTFKETGGVHSAALCSPSEIVVFSEDIGRHNAVDKILGQALMEDIRLQDKLLVTSGRISSEILLKAGKLGIAMIVSRTAPTSLSVELAEQLGITLVGFVRGGRMNIYTHAWRVI